MSSVTVGSVTIGPASYDTQVWRPTLSAPLVCPTPPPSAAACGSTATTTDSSSSSAAVATSAAYPAPCPAPASLADAFASLPIPDVSSLRAQLSAPAQLLRDGETIAFPTETVYGLGANTYADAAISKIYAAKGRPSDNPLIVHVATPAQLAALTPESALSPIALRLIKAFWPGPLTLVLRDAGRACPRVTAGLDTVAVRMPAHPLALALILEADLPLAAPSANASGRPSPTTAAHVLEDLRGRIAGVVDGAAVPSSAATAKPAAAVSTSASGGPHEDANGDDDDAVECAYGVESTVLDISHLPATQDVDLRDFASPAHGASQPPLAFILRPGGATLRQIEAVIGPGRVTYDPALLLDAAAIDSASRGANGDGSACDATGSELAVAPRAEGAAPSLGGVAEGLAPRSPGMKYTHYAPRAPLYLVVPSSSSSSSASACLNASSNGSSVTVSAVEGLVAHARAAAARGLTVGVLTTREALSAQAPVGALAAELGADKLVALSCGSRADLMSVAAKLYDALRTFDQRGVDVIFSETFSHDELGAAVMNRLIKSSGGKVLSAVAAVNLAK